MGNISKNLNSVEKVSSAIVAEQGKGMFNLDNDFSHEEEDVTVTLCLGKRSDWPMCLIIFSDVKKLVSVASLPKSMLMSVKGDVKLAAKELRVSFVKGQLQLG